MKKLALALILSALALGICGPAFAAGSWTTPTYANEIDTGTKVITATFTADSGDGTVPALSISSATYKLTGWYLLSVGTQAGATAPTSGWGVTVVDANNIPLIAATSMSTAAATGVSSMPTAWWPVVSDPSVTITGNSVHSATATVVLVWKKY